MGAYRRGSKIICWVGVSVLVLIAAACGDDDSDGAASTAASTVVSTSASTVASTDAPAESSAASTSPEPSTTQPATTATSAPQPEWVVHEAPEGCVCADGTPFSFWSRAGDPDRVVLYFQGGGACFSADSCSFTTGSFDPSVGTADDPSDLGGMFDLEHPDNPFAGWSVVYVPYCTGDVHLGDATTTYSPELTVEHNGYPNAAAGLDFLVESHPDAAQVFVTGSSAGGIPAPLFGGLVSDRLPGADIAVLADSSGGYQSDPGLNGVIGELWGTGRNIPDWPETSGLTTAEYGIPDLFVYAGRHDPAIRMARFDSAWDEVQRSFAAATGTGATPLPEVLDENEALVEAAGVDLSVYIAPGEDHVVLTEPEVYTLGVEGVTFIDWLTRFVGGDVPGDVRCVDCEPPSSVSAGSTSTTIG